MFQVKKAFITGVTGQDGSYLAELLLSKGYEVHALRRRVSTFNTDRIDHLINRQVLDRAGREATAEAPRFFMHYGDLGDPSSLYRLVAEIRPDEVYNLGAQSHVGVSFNIPEYTAQVDALAPISLLEAIYRIKPDAKFYQASSSEMFGNTHETPQKENTPFTPCSPYGCAKAFAFWATKNYRESRDLFAVNGILFNHESPRRGKTFVTRKITRAVARIKLGRQDKVYLGNLNAKRDWGYAPDYVEAIWQMLQHEKPDDFLVATGENHSVKEFVEQAFAEIGVKIGWRGQGVEEQGWDEASGKVLVEVDPVYFRPSELHQLLGDSSKAQKELGWRPKTSFDQLVKIMVAADLENEAKHNGWKSY